MSSSVNASLLNSLYRARKNIERNKDIYMDAEHELLCEYYRKYQELSKQFQNDKIKTTFNTFKMKSFFFDITSNFLKLCRKYKNYLLIYNKYIFFFNLFILIYDKIEKRRISDNWFGQ